MQPYVAVVLVCLAATSREACDETTAVEVRAVRVESELRCTMGWQEIIARGGDHEVGAGTYLKTVCRRAAEPAPSR
jgi:hypothetical protein